MEAIEGKEIVEAKKKMMGDITEISGEISGLIEGIKG